MEAPLCMIAETPYGLLCLASLGRRRLVTDPRGDVHPILEDAKM